MKLFILGLGNPGSKYLNTRHNLGHWFVDKVAHAHNSTFQKHKEFRVSSFKWETKDILLLKSLSFMNLNGKGLTKFFCMNSNPENSLVLVQDEMNLPLGRVKFSQGKSAGGHNGVKHVIEEIGFSPRRIRLGIRGQDEISCSLSDFVLSKLTKQEEKSFDDLFPKLYHTLHLLIFQGFSNDCNYINRYPIPAPSH